MDVLLEGGAVRLAAAPLEVKAAFVLRPVAEEDVEVDLVVAMSGQRGGCSPGREDGVGLLPRVGGCLGGAWDLRSAELDERDRCLGGRDHDILREATVPPKEQWGGVRRGGRGGDGSASPGPALHQLNADTSPHQRRRPLQARKRDVVLWVKQPVHL